MTDHKIEISESEMLDRTPLELARLVINRTMQHFKKPYRVDGFRETQTYGTDRIFEIKIKSVEEKRNDNRQQRMGRFESGLCSVDESLQ